MWSSSCAKHQGESWVHAILGPGSEQSLSSIDAYMEKLNKRYSDQKPRDEKQVSEVIECEGDDHAAEAQDGPRAAHGEAAVGRAGMDKAATSWIASAKSKASALQPRITPTKGRLPRLSSTASFAALDAADDELRPQKLDMDGASSVGRSERSASAIEKKDDRGIDEDC